MPRTYTEEEAKDIARIGKESGEIGYIGPGNVSRAEMLLKNMKKYPTIFQEDITAFEGGIKKVNEFLEKEERYSAAVDEAVHSRGTQLVPGRSYGNPFV